MNYSSVNFLLFVAVTLLAYFLLPLKKAKWTVLLAASIVFYMLAGYKFAAFIVITSVSTYLAALWIDKIAKSSGKTLAENKKIWDKEAKKLFKNKVKRQKRAVLALVLVLNFGILAFLKYYNMLAGSLNDLLGLFAVNFSAPTLKLFLPIGISFYTFQSMGYVVDVYRERVGAEKNYAKLLLFVSFFPQIIQGPIGIYSDLAYQLYEPHEFNFTRFKYGAQLIMWGFFKKLIIADRAVIAINAVTDNYNAYNGTTLTFTVLLYAIQLYADFSGGIDISRGAAQMFGIDMTENFKRPYFATSINDYWRRWHISLGAWLKNYLFYPLAMSGAFINASKKMKQTRFGKTAAGAHIAKVLPTSFASFIVFTVVGVWHGANMKYVAFGVYNGLIIMISILLKPVFDLILEKLKINAKSFGFRVFQMLRTFLIVLAGYVFDIAPSFEASMSTFAKAFCNQNFAEGFAQISGLGLSGLDSLIIAAGAAVIFVVSVLQERNSTVTLREVIDSKPFAVKYAVSFFGLLFIIMFGIYGPGYNAADFVYMQF